MEIRRPTLKDKDAVLSMINEFQSRKVLQMGYGILTSMTLTMKHGWKIPCDRK